MFSDVSRNPGPQVLHSEPTTRTHADLHTVSSRPKISYSRNELFKIRSVSYCSLSGRIFADLKRAGLLRLRGCRAGRRDFIRGIKVIASNRIEVECPRYALEHAEGVNILHQLTIIILGLSLFTHLHLVLRMDSRSECFWRSLVLFWRDLF